MSENILVVEYEPRYTDRVKQALAGQPFTTTFARDGEEAMKALEAEPRLIVLSSVVPKISTTELIRAIRGRKPLQETPILLTVSGYNGKSPKQDAQRVGASDILPKPYSETEFLGKIQQMLGIDGDMTLLDMTVRANTPSAGLTSNEIFGDLLEEDKPVRKTTASRSGNVDKMLADTLAGMMPTPRRKDAAPAVPVTPPAPAVPPPQSGPQAKPRTAPGNDLDKRLHDTLSGLEKNARRNTGPGTTARPAVPTPPPPAPAPAAPETPRFNTEKMKAYVPDRVPVSQPVFAESHQPARADEDEAVDGVKFGQYVLVEKIATGGMAEVWKARMRGVEGFQKIVAIKKILPHLSDNQDFIEMFVDEAKLAAQLNHNNIIHIYDLGKIQSSYYIAMEYIDGFDLKTILRRGEERGNPMQVELALFIASKIAAALDYAHRKRDFDEREMGLVHRDVSPQNVLISQEGDIKLCDFGIAKAASKASHTQAGALKGKLQYMSPEQAWGRSIDKRSDVFALAAVLFEMLTGRKLFSGDNELSILEQVREARVTAPSLFNDEVTPEIDKIVVKALQKDPANRYQTAGEMARDIDAILYSFKPTPTSADLAIYMHRISSDEPMMTEPDFEPEPVMAAPPSRPAAPVFTPAVAAAAAAPAIPIAVPAPAPVAAAAVAEPWHHDEPPAKKSAMPLIAIGVVVLLAAAAGGFVMVRGKGDAAPATTTATATTAAAVTPATATIVPAPTATALTTGTTATTGSLDPSLVDQEVAKRIAAERARLEALARQQQQQQAAQTATTATVAPARPAPAQVAEQRPTPQAEAPAPVVERPAPAPVQTQTQEPAPQVAAPQPAAPAPARPREGDLVAAGTEGLVPPRITRRGNVPYPPVARMQRIGGTVLTNVLVSETGQVLQVQVLRGVNRPVGLNEAAQETMRRSTFSPATKDGVRVKSWVTVPVDFKP